MSSKAIGQEYISPDKPGAAVMLAALIQAVDECFQVNIDADTGLISDEDAVENGRRALGRLQNSVNQAKRFLYNQG